MATLSFAPELRFRVNLFTMLLLCLLGLAGGIDWDDYAIVLAVIVTLVAAIGQFLTAWYGMGRDQWKVPSEDVTKVYKVGNSPFLASIQLDVLTLEQCFFISAVGYKLGNAATRASILCFYLRIFGQGSARITVLTCIILIILIGLAFTLADTLQCQPVWSFWEGWDGELSGRCGSLSAISWAHSIFNIVLDVEGQRDWDVLTGIALPPLSNTHNRTWNLAPVAYWSAIEMFAGMVCACLPALRVLGDKMCGTGRGVTRATTNGYERHTSHQRPSKVKTINPTLTFSENEDTTRNTKSRSEHGDNKMAVLPERKDDISVTGIHLAPWDATSGL
ncbi:CFEM domain-containing protein [Seiridium cupressi]